MSIDFVDDNTFKTPNLHPCLVDLDLDVPVAIVGIVSSSLYILNQLKDGAVVRSTLCIGGQ